MEFCTEKFATLVMKGRRRETTEGIELPNQKKIGMLGKKENYQFFEISELFAIHHHHVVPQARISLTLSRHFSLSFIASGRYSGLHPVSSHSCWIYVRAGRPAFARPYVGVHRSTSLMSSSLLLQQCPACLARLTWIVFVIGASGRIVGVLWGVAARTCSRLLAAFLSNCRLASFPAVLLASM